MVPKPGEMQVTLRYVTALRGVTIEHEQGGVIVHDSARPGYEQFIPLSNIAAIDFCATKE